MKGEWNDDGQRHGFGQLIFSDHSKYRGQFENGLFSGLGCVNYPDGSKYLQRKNNFLFFEEYYSRYYGEFFQGLYHGLGVFIRCDGMKYEGQFQNGKVYGLGLLTLADDSHGLPRNEGHFENNKLIRHEKCTDIIQKAIAIAERAKVQHK